ncbi:MAG TPA: hypothetical protein VLM90_03255 [Candidatus Deferrimicrobium sp.]|nr:hypothetical protein [Candidatus Deferrimicrobium sp.]
MQLSSMEESPKLPDPLHPRSTGYDSYGRGSANPSLLIGSGVCDPISGSLPHHYYLCRVHTAVPLD